MLMHEVSTKSYSHKYKDIKFYLQKYWFGETIQQFKEDVLPYMIMLLCQMAVIIGLLKVMF